jgi:hypothetical protein
MIKVPCDTPGQAPYPWWARTKYPAADDTRNLAAIRGKEKVYGSIP